MPFIETRFISPTTLTTSASSALYTVPTGYSAIIKQLVVTNTTGTAATFTFYIGAASAGNALFSGTSVAANDTVIINLSQVLATGETLRALASTGSALNLTVSGVLNDGPLASTATYIADNAITVNKIADGSVTTAKIATGAVIDIDVNDSAAIAQSKIANLTTDLAAKASLSGATFTGNILQPNRPAFYATGASGSYTSGTLPYNTATTNIGSHYNTTTRTFTAPIAGMYLFTTQHWAEPNAAGAIFLTVAGRNAVVGREVAQAGYEGYCGSQVAYMTAGQTATTSVYQGSVHLNSSLSYFSGVFLG